MSLLKSFKYKFQNFSTYFITWFFPKGRGRLFWKVYVYFRWVDDIVDDMKISQDYKRKFLKGQRQFIDSVYSSKKVNRKKLNYEEKGLYDVIKLYWSHKKSKEFKKHIYNMMWTFDYDIGRVGKHIKEKEFMKYSKYIGGAYAFVFMELFGIKEYEIKYNPITKKEFGKTIKQLAEDYAHYCHLAHIFRDEKEDIKKGYYNFPYGKDKAKFSHYIDTIVIPTMSYSFLVSKKFINDFFLILILKSYQMRFKKIICIMKYRVRILKNAQ
jgi:phytoene/squalene synthetase